MSKLMSANLLRLRKNKLFWLCAVIMAAIGAAVGAMSGGSHPEGFFIDRTFFAYTVPLEFACGVFCSLFIGADYSDGTVRNKIVVGRSRVSIYLSNLFTCTLAGLAFICAYIAPMLAVGIPRLGLFKMETGKLFLLIGITVMMMLAICAIFTLIAMLCQNKAAVAVICLVGLVSAMLFCSWVNSRLNEPEFYDSFVYSDAPVQMSRGGSDPNPNYLRGTEREVYQFAAELLPVGQALLFVDMSLVHTWRLMLYSLIITVLTTAAGVYVFRKKDLR